MFESSPYRQVTLAALVALLTVSGAAAGAPATTDAPTFDDSTAASPAAVAQENASVTFPAEPLVLRSAENQTIHVRTNAEPGTTLDFDIESDSRLWTGAAEVAEDGTAAVSFDLSEVEAGTELEVGAYAAGFSGGETVRALVVNASATVHRDGTLTVSEPGADYPIRGRSDLPPGTELDVRLNGSESSFAASRSAVVDANGSFGATFDLSSLPEGAELTVDIGGLPRPVSALVTTDDRPGATVYARPDVPAEATIRRSGDAVSVRAAPNQTIRGTTNVQPGTELVVTVENTEMNVPNPVELSETVTVGEGGEFAAAFDFDGADPGTALAVEVSRPGGPPLAHVDGRVVNESVEIPTTTETPFTTTEPETEDVSMPGFGVSAGVVALLVALLVSRRA